MEARAAVQVADRTIETWSLPVPDRLRDDEALLTVRGAMASSEWGKRQAIRILGAHKYDRSKVHTHTFPIDQLDRAMRILGGEVPGEEAVHVTIVPS